MNRLLQLCLLVIVLLALAYGEQNNKDQSLEQNKHGRQQHGKIKIKKKIKRAKSRKNKAMDKRKQRKMHENAKGKESVKRKDRKVSKTKRTKALKEKLKTSMKKAHKKGNKKNMRKTKNKKKRKQRKNSNKKKYRKGVNKRNKKKNTRKGKNRRNKNKVRTCMDDSCIDNAVKYIKILKDKVKNYLSQTTRVEKFNKTAGSKAGKKSLFSPIINRIREAGGGNISNLKCNGNSTGNGAQAMKNLTDALGNCESNIKKSCVTSLPNINVTKSRECKSSMSTFTTMVKTCMAKTGTEGCQCWTNESFTAVVARVKTCDHSAANKQMTKAQKGCIAAFGACRKLEDSVSETLSACSPDNTATKAKVHLKNAKANKIAASSLIQKINETINVQSRAKTNLSCNEFINKTKRINQHLSNAPLKKELSSSITVLANQTISSCSTNETTKLKFEKQQLVSNIEIIEEAIKDIQNDLKIQTGTTSSIDTSVKIAKSMLTSLLLSI